MKVLDHLLKAVRAAAVHNPEVQTAPACILWPDKDRQWEAVIPRLQAEMPELLVLGDFDPAQRTGPGIWLRVVLAGLAPDVALSDGRTPILYLPGVSRQDLRAVESCPELLKPLAELQYRGVIWSQVNAKDWTTLAFMLSNQGGLGLDVAQDAETRSGLLLALPRFLDEDVDLLRGKRLDKDYFNELLSDGDPIRNLLHWLDKGDSFRVSMGEESWQAFVAVCQSKLAFNPASAGPLAGALKLAEGVGPWRAVWDRFREAPRRYPHIPARIRQCQMPLFDLFATLDQTGGWPQWNAERESALAHDLRALAQHAPHEARKRLLALEDEHSERRGLVWAELGEAPLALALEPLARLATLTQTGLNAGTLEDLETGYAHQGWQADDAVLAALALVDKLADVEAVTAAIRAVYLPWLQDSARHLQHCVRSVQSVQVYVAVKPATYAPTGECVLFVDGLRFDLAKRLAARLETAGYGIHERSLWAALPSVTATGKAAVSPVREQISGADVCADFEPQVAATGQSLKGGYHLGKLLKEAGWSTVAGAGSGDTQGFGWCEFGDIDSEGHNRGWKLARQVESLLDEVQAKIVELLEAGWPRVRVVTDHGWLLLPGGLPKVELAGVLTETKWGRCAAIKPGAMTSEGMYPWFWNPALQFALADGVGCYQASQEYTHGGLSLQECLTLELTVTPSKAGPTSQTVTFTQILWRGLRCSVTTSPSRPDLSLDIRLEPGNPSSSVLQTRKPLTDEGKASVLVEDDLLVGNPAWAVLLDGAGDLVATLETTIGKS